MPENHRWFGPRRADPWHNIGMSLGILLPCCGSCSLVKCEGRRCLLWNAHPKAARGLCSLLGRPAFAPFQRTAYRASFHSHIRDPVDSWHGHEAAGVLDSCVAPHFSPVSPTSKVFSRPRSYSKMGRQIGTTTREESHAEAIGKNRDGSKRIAGQSLPLLREPHLPTGIARRHACSIGQAVRPLHPMPTASWY